MLVLPEGILRSQNDENDDNLNKGYNIVLFLNSLSYTLC